MKYLNEEEIQDALNDEFGEPVFGVLYDDGESIDCVDIQEAVEMKEKRGGDIYTY